MGRGPVPRVALVRVPTRFRAVALPPAGIAGAREEASSRKADAGCCTEESLESWHLVRGEDRLHQAQGLADGAGCCGSPYSHPYRCPAGILETRQRNNSAGSVKQAGNRIQAARRLLKDWTPGRGRSGGRDAGVGDETSCKGLALLRV